MQSKTFRGKDKADIDQQMWEWRVDNPKIKVLEVHPIERLRLEPHPEQGFRACLGILRLEKSYGAQRLEAASSGRITFRDCSASGKAASPVRHAL